MSGSSHNYQPSENNSFNCDAGIINTNLASPFPLIIQQHSVGETLYVSIINGILVVENDNGEILGSVLHENTQDIKDCIALGNNYIAKIISKTQFNCYVRISKS